MEYDKNQQGCEYVFNLETDRSALVKKGYTAHQAIMLTGGYSKDNWEWAANTLYKQGEITAMERDAMIQNEVVVGE